mmetsp:Transcript_20035/g.70850  ORF Transcript_20035/g.70850 Transcript_20035/m.70850 type:complete len:510 (-) Transcript_20035:104-1633(-)
MGAKDAPRLLSRVRLFLWTLAKAALKFASILFRLVAFAVLLSPVAIRVVIFYLCSSRVKRAIRYGDRFRQRLDVYLPRRSQLPASGDGEGAAASGGAATPARGAPVLIFVPGGAWLMGHRSWAALLGKLFAARGVLCVVPDYRNFPCGRVDQMVPDVSSAIAYAFAHAEEWGGDPKRVFLAGQSAGAHIAAMAVLLQAKRERDDNKAHTQVPGGTPGVIGTPLSAIAEDEGPGTPTPDAAAMPDASPTVTDAAGVTAAPEPPVADAARGGPQPLAWRTSALRGFIGISGPYDLPGLRDYLVGKGMDGISFIDHIMGGKGASKLSRAEKDDKLRQYSPTLRMRGPSFAHRGSVVSLLPEFTLLHGTSDSTVPDGSSSGFGAALRDAGVRASVTTYAGKSHTDPIIEDLLAESDEDEEAEGPDGEDLRRPNVIRDMIEAMHRGDLRGGGDGTPPATPRRRTPSMLVDGLGAVASDDFGTAEGSGGRPGVGARQWHRIAKVLVAAARKANPF